MAVVPEGAGRLEPPNCRPPGVAARQRALRTTLLLRVVRGHHYKGLKEYTLVSSAKKPLFLINNPLADFPVLYNTGAFTHILAHY